MMTRQSSRISDQDADKQKTAELRDQLKQTLTITREEILLSKHEHQKRRTLKKLKAKFRASHVMRNLSLKASDVR